MSSITAICLAGWTLILPLGHFMLRYAYRAHGFIDKGAKVDAQILVLKAFGVTLIGLSVSALLYALRWQIPALLWPAIYATVVCGLALILQLRARYRLHHE